MLAKKIIKESFSRSAVHYDKHAVLQREMAEKLFRLVKEQKYQRILDIGCGTGYLTAKMAKFFPQAEIVGLDLAPGMIEVAKEKYAFKNLEFMLGDGEDLPFPNHYFDLVVSNASLQWMNLKKVGSEVKRVLVLGGDFIFSTFGSKTLWELKSVGFRVNDFNSLSDLFRDLMEFEILQAQLELVNKQFKTVKEIVYYLKEIGADISSGNSKFGFDPFSGIKNYREKYGARATFEIIYLCASRRKSHPTP
ncbi:MAG: malonyl-ACP O-methyltransferase BioC [Candidatus Margulisiibacteriota bacterium]